MAHLTRSGDVTIHYDVEGEGFPILAIAPGGMKSVRERWKSAPFDPTARLSDRYRVITMDQRNAGDSWAPVSSRHGWATYTEDQLALLDHLGVDRFIVMGMCIGGPYALRLCLAAPERVAGAVLFQPIGLEDNRDAFEDLFDQWATQIEGDHPEALGEAWTSFKRNMFGGDFLFGVTREDAAKCNTPALVMMGNDRYHPQSVSRDLVEIMPNAELIERWKDGSDLDASAEAIDAFLARHAT
jgi:pimeloyl-ACP methyl ester carboxylesterase